MVRDNLPDGYREGMQFGMIGWYVPLERFPDTYNGQPLGLAGLANQKNYMSLYLNTVYGDRATERWFRERYAASGKALNMGKSCVRFQRVEDLPLDVIAETIARADLDRYLESLQGGSWLLATHAFRRCQRCSLSPILRSSFRTSTDARWHGWCVGSSA